MRTLKHFLLSILCSPAIAFAQLPAVDIYVTDIRMENGQMQFATPVNITARVGYDNQPYFENSGTSLLYTSIQSNDQADIYRYDCLSGTTSQVTHTNTSEYSPMPTADGDGFTVVMVEPDTTQRLWQFTGDLNQPEMQPVLKRVDSIGYYCMANNKQIAFFKVTDPPTLVITDVKKQTERTVDVQIGRCLKMIPGTANLSYLVKTNDTIYSIFQLSGTQKYTRSLITTSPSGYEDFVWTTDGRLWMAREHTIWQFDPKVPQSGWQQIATFPTLAGKQIFRVALNADGTRLAFVCTE